MFGFTEICLRFTCLQKQNLSTKFGDNISKETTSLKNYYQIVCEVSLSEAESQRFKVDSKFAFPWRQELGLCVIELKPSLFTGLF